MDPTNKLAQTISSYVRSSSNDLRRKATAVAKSNGHALRSVDYVIVSKDVTSLVQDYTCSYSHANPWLVKCVHGNNFGEYLYN